MATQDPTTNYNWDLPDVGGDDGAWGTLLNTIIGDDSTGIDAVLGDHEDRVTALETLTAALPASPLGGAFIVQAPGQSYSSPDTVLGALFVQLTSVTSAAGQIDIDLTAVAAAGGATFAYTDFLGYTFNGVRTSDDVVVNAVYATTSSNKITITLKYRDGATVGSANIRANVVLYFGAAPA